MGVGVGAEGVGVGVGVSWADAAEVAAGVVAAVVGLLEVAVGPWVAVGTNVGNDGAIGFVHKWKSTIPTAIPTTTLAAATATRRVDVACLLENHFMLIITSQGKQRFGLQGERFRFTAAAPALRGKGTACIRIVGQGIQVCL